MTLSNSLNLCSVTNTSDVEKFLSFCFVQNAFKNIFKLGVWVHIASYEQVKTFCLKCLLALSLVLLLKLILLLLI